MYRFVPPLVVLALHDSKLCSCLLSSLFAVLRVLYAIVRLSSVQISDRGFFQFRNTVSADVLVFDRSQRYFQTFNLGEYV